MLFEDKGLDPYLEEPGTLWLLHWNLASRPDGPTTWYWGFNHFPEAEFTKERLIAALQDIAEQANWTRVAENSLKRDVDCFIRTYVPSRATKSAGAGGLVGFAPGGAGADPGDRRRPGLCV